MNLAGFTLEEIERHSYAEGNATLAYVIGECMDEIEWNECPKLKDEIEHCEDNLAAAVSAAVHVINKFVGKASLEEAMEEFNDLK